MAQRTLPQCALSSNFPFKLMSNRVNIIFLLFLKMHFSPDSIWFCLSVFFLLQLPFLEAISQLHTKVWLIKRKMNLSQGNLSAIWCAEPPMRA